MEQNSDDMMKNAKVLQHLGQQTLTKHKAVDNGQETAKVKCSKSRKGNKVIHAQPVNKSVPVEAEEEHFQNKEEEKEDESPAHESVEPSEMDELFQKVLATPCTFDTSVTLGPNNIIRNCDSGPTGRLLQCSDRETVTACLCFNPPFRDTVREILPCSVFCGFNAHLEPWGSCSHHLLDCGGLSAVEAIAGKRSTCQASAHLKNKTKSVSKTEANRQSSKISLKPSRQSRQRAKKPRMLYLEKKFYKQHSSYQLPEVAADSSEILQSAAIGDPRGEDKSPVVTGKSQLPQETGSDFQAYSPWETKPKTRMSLECRESTKAKPCGSEYQNSKLRESVSKCFSLKRSRQKLYKPPRYISPNALSCRNSEKVFPNVGNKYLSGTGSLGYGNRYLADCNDVGTSTDGLLRTAANSVGASKHEADRKDDLQSSLYEHCKKSLVLRSEKDCLQELSSFNMSHSCCSTSLEAGGAEEEGKMRAWTVVREKTNGEDKLQIRLCKPTSESRSGVAKVQTPDKEEQVCSQEEKTPNDCPSIVLQEENVKVSSSQSPALKTMQKICGQQISRVKPCMLYTPKLAQSAQNIASSLVCRQIQSLKPEAADKDAGKSLPAVVGVTRRENCSDRNYRKLGKPSSFDARGETSHSFHYNNSNDNKEDFHGRTFINRKTASATVQKAEEDLSPQRVTPGPQRPESRLKGCSFRKPTAQAIKTIPILSTSAANYWNSGTTRHQTASQSEDKKPRSKVVFPVVQTQGYVLQCGQLHSTIQSEKIKKTTRATKFVKDGDDGKANSDEKCMVDEMTVVSAQESVERDINDHRPDNVTAERSELAEDTEREGIVEEAHIPERYALPSASMEPPIIPISFYLNDVSMRLSEGSRLTQRTPTVPPNSPASRKRTLLRRPAGQMKDSAMSSSHRADQRNHCAWQRKGSSTAFMPLRLTTVDLYEDLMKLSTKAAYLEKEETFCLPHVASSPSQQDSLKVLDLLLTFPNQDGSDHGSDETRSESTRASQKDRPSTALSHHAICWSQGGDQLTTTPDPLSKSASSIVSRQTVDRTQSPADNAVRAARMKLESCSRALNLGPKPLPKSQGFRSRTPIQIPTMCHMKIYPTQNTPSFLSFTPSKVIPRRPSGFAIRDSMNLQPFQKSLGNIGSGRGRNLKPERLLRQTLYSSQTGADFSCNCCTIQRKSSYPEQNKEESRMNNIEVSYLGQNKNQSQTSSVEMDEPTVLCSGKSMHDFQAMSKDPENWEHCWNGEFTKYRLSQVKKGQPAESQPSEDRRGGNVEQAQKLQPLGCRAAPYLPPQTTVADWRQANDEKVVFFRLDRFDRHAACKNPSTTGGTKDSSCSADHHSGTSEVKDPLTNVALSDPFSNSLKSGTVNGVCTDHRDTLWNREGKQPVYVIAAKEDQHAEKKS